jgi:hypothetical protein
LAHPQLVSAVVHVHIKETDHHTFHTAMETLSRMNPQLHKLSLTTDQNVKQCMVVPGMRTLDFKNLRDLTLVQPAELGQHRYDKLFYAHWTVALTYNTTLQHFRINGPLCDQPGECLEAREAFMQALGHHQGLESVVLYI